MNNFKQLMIMMGIAFFFGVIFGLYVSSQVTSRYQCLPGHNGGKMVFDTWTGDAGYVSKAWKPESK